MQQERNHKAANNTNQKAISDPPSQTVQQQERIQNVAKNTFQGEYSLFTVLQQKRNHHVANSTFLRHLPTHPPQTEGIQAKQIALNTNLIPSYIPQHINPPEYNCLAGNMGFINDQVLPNYSHEAGIQTLPTPVPMNSVNIHPYGYQMLYRTFQ